MRWFAMLAAAAVLVPALTMKADVIYTYTGNDFTTVSGQYTTSDSITGYLDVSGPLPGNYGDGSPLPLTISRSGVQVVDYSFSDGVDTLTNLDSGASIWVGTDADGNITTWSIQLYGGAEDNALYRIFTNYYDSVTAGEFASKIGDTSDAG